MRFLVLVAVAAAAFVLGCTGDLPLPQEVDIPVLLGARVEVAGAAHRARPRAGETFTIRVFVGRSKKPKAAKDQQLTALVSLCAGGRLPSGSLLCLDEYPLESFGLVTRPVSANEIDLDLVLPAQVLAALEGMTDRFTLFGAVCTDSRAVRVKGKDVAKDPVTELFRCDAASGTDAPEPLSFTFDVYPDFADNDLDDNKNPEITCDDPSGACAHGIPHEHEPRVAGNLTLTAPAEGSSQKRVTKLWPEEVDAQPWQQDCASNPLFDGFTIRTDDDKYLVRFRADPSDRQRYDVAEERRGVEVIRERREELLISHALTKGGGSLERYFSVVREETPERQAEIEVELTPPELDEDGVTVPKSGRIARFFLFVGDGRGGGAFTTRALCVVPGEAD